MEIRLGKNDKRTIEGTNDVYGIMQRILLRENRIDQEKEHLWMIGMNEAGYILYIELVALGTFRAVNIEPMNVFRIAVMKNASRVIAIHNHPSGSLKPSEADLDMTDRLIQVGRILNIEFMDHLIITPITYLSFRGEGIMDKLEASLKYVPTYQIIESIRKEERKIAREKLELEKNKTKAAKEAEKTAKDATKEAKEKARLESEQRRIEQERREKLEFAMATVLRDKDLSIEDIAKIMEITPEVVENILNKK